MTNDDDLRKAIAFLERGEDYTTGYSNADVHEIADMLACARGDGMVVGAAIIAMAEAIRANAARGRCREHDSGGARCELREGHFGGCACPETIRRSFKR